MQHLLEKLDSCYSELQSLLPIKEEYQKTLDKKFRLEFNFNSNHIEGNTLTYGETELLLFFDDTQGNHTMREYEEMQGHDIAFTLVKQWALDSSRPLTESDVRELNKIILVKPFWKEALTADGQQTRRQIGVGIYKQFPNSVRLSNGEMFEYASVIDTPILMKELLEWYHETEVKQELHPVAIAAILHYKFVRIHPFDDGNGRIARLLTNYILQRHNYPPLIIKSKDKTNYLNALHKADVGDLNAFVSYVVESEFWSLELSIRAAKGEKIEEPDDIDKEIFVWKKAVVTTFSESQHKSDRLILELYESSLNELFELLDTKLVQLYEMFRVSKVTSFVNDTRGEGISWLSQKLQSLVHKSFEKETENSDNSTSEESSEVIDLIFVRINLDEYKYNYQHPFSVTVILKCTFEPYKYLISYNQLVMLEKKYGEILSPQEIRSVVDSITKSVFEEIQQKAKVN